jgi:hypothetical protein
MTLNAGWISSGLCIINFTTPRLTFSDAAAPADTKVFSFVATGQTFYLQALTDVSGFLANLWAVNRNGTFTILNATSNQAARLIFGAQGGGVAIRTESNNNLGITSPDNTAYAGLFCAAITAYGAITCNSLTTTAGNVQVAGNIHNSAGYVFPGNLSTSGGIQGNWYIAGHSSYGLYINTGLYIAAGLTLGTGLSLPNGAVNALGYLSRAGTAGAAGANNWVLNWTGAMQLWVDATNLGNIAVTSDARIKRDFTPLVGILDKIRQLRPGSYYFKQYGGYPEDKDLHFGLTGQDVMPVIPALVHNTEMITELTPDGMLRIDYMEMIPLLVAAIQELERKLDASTRH